MQAASDASAGCNVVFSQAGRTSNDVGSTPGSRRPPSAASGGTQGVHEQDRVGLTKQPHAMHSPGAQLGSLAVLTASMADC